MSIGRAGHGAKVYVELDPVGAQGVFTEIPELRGDIPGLSGTRDETNITPHNDDIDSWVHGPIVRNPLAFSINFVPGNAVHEALRTAWLSSDPEVRRRGWKFVGAGGGPGDDEVIGSGELSSWEDTSPEGAGVRSASLSVRLSKAIIVDGVQYGNAS